MKRLITLGLIWAGLAGGIFCCEATALAARDSQAQAGAVLVDDEADTTHILAIFEGIAQVPRCSKHEQRISAWLVQWAKDRALPVKTDALHNVLISVPASPGLEDRPAVALQAHMDMVCQKTVDSDHDFATDPIILVRDGDWLRAKDTTLGADDGIGIAMALFLAEAKDIRRPALELLFTTDEEVDNTPLRTEVLHAGLECGFIAEKYPHMEIISIGPTLEYVHTPKERLHMPSVGRTARFLRELLKDLGE